MNNGSANLRLVNDLEYKVELTHSNATIDTNITNNDATFIQAGDNKSLSLLLSDAYCSGSVATPPNTYILDGLTYTETPFINASGTIDLDDYLSPSMSTQLRYTEFSKFADNPETEISTFTDVTVSGNMTTLVDEGTNRTELNVLSDRINLTQYETDLNDMQVVSRDSFVGRFYNPGDTFYEVAISGTTFIQEGTVDVSNEFNGNLSCVIEEKLNSFSERTFTYSGDIVKVRCTLSALSTITDNITSETTFVSTRSTDLSYYKSGTSIIITNNSVCIAPGTTISDDLSECQTTFSTDKYFVESFPEL